MTERSLFVSCTLPKASAAVMGSTTLCTRQLVTAVTVLNTQNKLSEISTLNHYGLAVKAGKKLH